MGRSCSRTLSSFALTWALAGVFQPDAFADGPTCPDAADLYAQCPNFASNGQEARSVAYSDVAADVSVADNFTLQAQGTIRRIRWWGTYLLFGADAGCGPHGSDGFTVFLWNDGDGDPAGPDPLPISSYSVTRSNEPVGEIPVGLGPSPVYEYELAFQDDTFKVAPGEIYWLEVLNDPEFCNWVWVTAPSPPGDGTCRQRSPSTDPDWSAPTVRGFDLAFSLLSDAVEPIPAVSDWAMVMMIALLLGTGAIVLKRRGGPEIHRSHARYF